MPMMLKLASRGNPDFGENPTRPIPGVEDKVVEVADFAEASAVCRKWIEENDLGGGNWSGGQLTDEAGKPVAYVSYNGRVWSGSPGEWSKDSVPLYPPSADAANGPKI